MYETMAVERQTSLHSNGMRTTRVSTVEVLEVLLDEPCQNHDAKDPK
jgi:hypothetical protein